MPQAETPIRSFDARAALQDVRSGIEAAKAEGMTDAQRVNMLVGIQKGTFNLIRHADGKAQMLLRIVLALAGVAFIGVPPTVAALKNFASEGSWQLGLFIAVTILYLFCTVCLLVSVFKIMKVIRPRKGNVKCKSSAFFHRSIVRMEYDEFNDMVRTIQPSQSIDELSAELYQMAHIAAAKFDAIDEAIGWMMGGGLFGIFFAIILMVSFGLT